MAKVVCVLYDDPVAGYPKYYARDDVPKLERYPDGQTLPTPKGIDFQPGSCWAASPVNLDCGSSLKRRATSWWSPRTRTVRTQVGAGTAGCRHRDLAAILARLHHRGAHREGAEAQTRHHRRHRLGPCGPAGGDGSRYHRRRSNILQQHQRCRTRGDDDLSASCAITFPPTIGSLRRAGTSPTAWPVPTMWRA